MKTIKISEETHQKLSFVKAMTKAKTLNKVIDTLIEADPVYLLGKLRTKNGNKI